MERKGTKKICYSEKIKERKGERGKKGRGGEYAVVINANLFQSIIMKRRKEIRKKE